MTELNPQPPSEHGTETRVVTGRIASTLAYPDAPGRTIDVSLSWDSEDPFAAILVAQYPGARTAPEWCLSIEQLIAGGGVGLVFIVHTEHDTCILLESPEGFVELILPADYVRRFIDRVTQAEQIGDDLPILGDSDEEWDHHWAVITEPRPAGSRKAQ